MKLTPQQAQDTFIERLAAAKAALTEEQQRFDAATAAYIATGDPEPYRWANDALDAAYAAVSAVYRSLLYGVPE